MSASCALDTSPPASSSEPSFTRVDIKGSRFIVFFEAYSSDLLPEAKKAIAEAVEEFHLGKSVILLLLWHSDSVGSEEYARALTNRRVASVKAELLRLGLNESVIDIDLSPSFGFRDLTPVEAKIGHILIRTM
jgi:outer membrane protein OmpA-like peptidoglycan-associated protein